MLSTARSVHLSPRCRNAPFGRTGPQSAVRAAWLRSHSSPSLHPAQRGRPGVSPAICLICTMGFPPAALQRWMKGGDVTGAAAGCGPWWLFNQRPISSQQPRDPLGFHFSLSPPRTREELLRGGPGPSAAAADRGAPPGTTAWRARPRAPATSLRRRHGHHPCFSGGETEARGSNQSEVMDWAVAQPGWKPQPASRAHGLLHC